jgi:hypothetical protein
MYLLAAEARGKIVVFSRSSRQLLESEDPDGSTFGNLGELAGERAVQGRLHATRIAAPARVNRKVLFPVDQEGGRRREDA